MPVAAVPNYLGKDFSKASPGLRFGMYLPLWGVESRTGELRWKTHDVNYRVTGRDGQERQFEDQNKTQALRSACRLNQSDLDTMHALGRRQTAMAQPLMLSDGLLALHGEAVAPFTTGLGNEHPLENGFAFLNPYGLPYLAGSGVKGVVLQAARELVGGEWGDAQGWTVEAITALFGAAVADADGEATLQRGALMFWDVLPQIEGDALQVEVMTPHQNHYYQDGKSPHESGVPNPINFLTVPPGSKFVFHVQCDQRRLDALLPELAQIARWQQMIRAAMAHAFQWLGFGAKTAVGYGAMAPDARGQAQADEARAMAVKQAELQGMTAAQRDTAEFIDAMRARSEQLKGGKDKPNTEFHQRAQKLAKAALEGGDWTVEEKAAAADAIEAWLPKVVNLDAKDAFKKLKLRTLRGLA